MRRPIDFSGHAHRCLFRNDCVQAHLLGLTPGCASFESCFPQSATVIVTYGEACARIAGRDTQLRAGDQVEIPQSCPLRLFTDSEADVMLLLKPQAAAEVASSPETLERLPAKIRFSQTDDMI